MTSKDFEKAQLRLDIEAIQELDRQRHERLRISEGDVEQMKWFLQEYFDGRTD